MAVYRPNYGPPRPRSQERLETVRLGDLQYVQARMIEIAVTNPSRLGRTPGDWLTVVGQSLIHAGGALNAQGDLLDGDDP